MKVSETSKREITLAHKTARLGHLIHRYYQADAREKGFGGDPTRGQGRILALLSAKPETTQRELSYLLDIRQQSLSELLAKLEEKGYIERTKSAEDGRVTNVTLTEAGAAAAPDLTALNERVDVIDCLDADERAQFETLIDKITTSITAKLEEKGIDPHMHRGPHHGGPHGPHMMKRGPHRGDGPCGHHGMRQA